MGQIFLKRLLRLVYESLRMRIRMEKRIKISNEGCAFSAFLITSEILSMSSCTLLAYLSRSPIKTMKQTLMKDLILFLFSVDSLLKNEVEIVTLSRYSANKF